MGELSVIATAIRKLENTWGGTIGNGELKHSGGEHVRLRPKP